MYLHEYLQQPVILMNKYNIELANHLDRNKVRQHLHTIF